MEAFKKYLDGLPEEHEDMYDTTKQYSKLKMRKTYLTEQIGIREAQFKATMQKQIREMFDPEKIEDDFFEFQKEQGDAAFLRYRPTQILN